MKATKIILSCCIFSATLTVSALVCPQFKFAASLPAIEPDNTAAPRISFNGRFRLDPELLPNEFRELEAVEIRPVLDQSGESIPNRLQGTLYAGKSLKLMWIGTFGKRIKFVTETVNGVRFEFNGYSSSDDCARLAGKADIAGEMIKIVGDKWDSSAPVYLYERCGWM